MIEALKDNIANKETPGPPTFEDYNFEKGQYKLPASFDKPIVMSDRSHKKDRSRKSSIYKQGSDTSHTRGSNKTPHEEAKPVSSLKVQEMDSQHKKPSTTNLRHKPILPHQPPP